MAVNLQIVTNALITLQNNPRHGRCCHTIKSLRERIKKLRGHLIANRLSELCLRGVHKLDQLTKSELFEHTTHLNQRQLDEAKLDAIISTVCATLRECYRTLIVDFHRNSLGRSQNSSNIQNGLTAIQQNAIKSLADYSDYLVVKGMRNMTLSVFNDEAIGGGLSSFVYIDRNTNELIISPLQATRNHQEIAHYNWIKHSKRMIDFAHSSVINGKLTSMWSDDEFLYSHMIWFEDVSVRKMMDNIHAR